MLRCILGIPFMDSAGCLLKTKRHTNFHVKFQNSVLELWTSFISSATFVFRRKGTEFFLSKKVCQIKTGQKNMIVLVCLTW